MIILSPGGKGKIYWTPSLNIGIEKIDSQHKELFFLVNDLMDILAVESHSETFKAAFDFLEDYAVSHFGEEERYMYDFSYPGVEEHKKQHELFKSTLGTMKRSYEEYGATEPFLWMIRSQLAAWTMTHVKSVDKMLGDFLKENSLVLP